MENYGFNYGIKYPTHESRMKEFDGLVKIYGNVEDALKAIKACDKAFELQRKKEEKMFAELRK